MVHQEYKELFSVHALTALQPGDARMLTAHLEQCSECRSAMDQWEETVGLLAFDAGAAEPSHHLRERILQTARNSPASSQGGGQTADATNVIPMPVQRSHSFSMQSWAAIAAVFAFGAFVISLLVLWSQHNASKQELALLSIQVKDAQQQLARQREAIEIVTTPGTQSVELEGTEVAPEAHATVAYDRSGRAVLLANNLPPTPEGKAYQLWFVVSGQLTPGKLFLPDTSGHGSVEDQIPAAARGSTGFAITLEPEGGVAAPTGPIYLRSDP
ncbi:MAG TPA: anti-sigma factor [Pyrinomonadaceae bacterium]|nr:anti-sigma factor [Pyrinomonadaceae bacterium]